jgi:hypothetical protein
MLFMSENSANKAGAGKGDKPRSCFSKQFKDNYDLINWKKNKKNNDKENINNNDVDTEYWL